MAEQIDGVCSGLVVQPGDRVIIGMVDDDADALVDIDEQLRRRFPDVEFTIIAGVGAIAAYRERHIISLHDGVGPDA